MVRGDGEVLALESQRAQLDRQQHRHLLREGAQVVGRARQARCAGHAAEPEDRCALDVGAQAQTVDEAGVEVLAETIG